MYILGYMLSFQFIQLEHFTASGQSHFWHFTWWKLSCRCSDFNDTISPGVDGLLGEHSCDKTKKTESHKLTCLLQFSSKTFCLQVCMHTDMSCELGKWSIATFWTSCTLELLDHRHNINHWDYTGTTVNICTSLRSVLSTELVQYEKKM